MDAIERRSIIGWAYDDALGTSAPVEILVDGRLVGETTGTIFRPDLLAAGVGNGQHGFVFDFGPEVTFETPTVVMVRFAGGGGVLLGGARVAGGQDLAKSELFQAALADGIWRIDAVEEDGDTMTVAGWGVPPFGMPIPFTVLRNGTPPTAIERFVRPDVAQHLGLRVRDPVYGFRCRYLDRAPRTREFAFVDARSNAPFAAYQSVHVAVDGDRLPEDQRRRRVGGSPDEWAFRMIGATAFARLERVVPKYFGRSLDDAGDVLDWGCGCGRVLRYFKQQERVTGIDIDADNLAWCAANFPHARFHVVTPQPPTTLPAGSFDLVFGISVMTHLTEENHLAWLAELRRITRPGAAVLLTVHGETAWLDGALPLEPYAAWRTTGFSVVGKNDDLAASDADTSFYYNSFVSRRYVFERWAAYFEVLDVLAGALITQDLVVLRRRAD